MPRIIPLTALAGALALLLACSPKQDATSAPAAAPVAAASAKQDAEAGNPLFSSWSTPFSAVPFNEIQLAHLAPALELAMANQLAAISAITANSEAATVENTLIAMEIAATDMRRVGAVYGVYTANLSDDEVRKLETEFAPKMSAHQNKILLDPKLFARVKAIFEANAASAAASAATSAATSAAGGSDAETARLTEQTYHRFVRAGAALEESARAKVAELGKRESELMTRFNQNLLKDTEAFTLELGQSELDGLPDAVRATAQQTAKDMGKAEKYVFTLQRPDYEGFMTFSTRRDLRERYFNAFIKRGNNGNAFDNKAIISELVKTRAERATILGFQTFAESVTAESMAKTPEAALALLQRVWTPALAQAKRDRDTLQALIKSKGDDFKLAGWDWRHYAEQVRIERYQVSASEIAPYFTLDNMLNASFAVTGRLFGISYVERKDIPVYHPDVRVFEVLDNAKQHVGLFYVDYFARTGKRSGAWMASYRAQSRLDTPITAHVVNNLNVPKPPEGQPALISLTEATTLFHELGHALHGLLSNVKYPSLSGTSVPRDYVEFPAQILEHYVLQPPVLKEFALHHQTKQPMSDALIARLLESEKFDQGFATVEFVASALVDQRFHALTPEQAASVDAAEFERTALAELGAIEEIPMRHRSTQFSHVFGGGYSAAYYAYMWSEVLDSDGFAAFVEAGNIFDPATAARLKDWVYSRGNTVDWSEAYRNFRGRDPDVNALLENRGLLSDDA